MNPIKLEIDCKDLPQDAHEVLERECARVGKNKSEVLKTLILDAIDRPVKPDADSPKNKENSAKVSKK